ncbi:MAG: hypothetical protein EA358_10900 [Flavobacteriales bacterium]|nr:MAG: hypothetical protein EA358_10900 [Flavobacteriales bacterium]
MTKKGFIGLLALSMAVTSCSSDDENGGTPGRQRDPIDNLSTPPKMYGAVINAGPILPKAVLVETVVRTAKLEGVDNLFVVHLPGENSIFYDAERNSGLKDFIQPLGGANDFYVNSDLYTNDPAMDYTELVPVGPPIAAVNHMVTQVRPDSIIANARVEFFEQLIDRKFRVATYLLAEFHADTDPTTGVSFNAPAIPNILATVNGISSFTRNIPSDTIRIFNEGEMLKYQYVVVAEPRNHPLGLALDSVSIFGKEFDPGDVLGTRETPLRFALARNHIHLSRVKGLALWTVLYEIEEEIDPADPDGPPLVEYIIRNTFLSKI